MLIECFDAQVLKFPEVHSPLSAFMSTVDSHLSLLILVPLRIFLGIPYHDSSYSSWFVSEIFPDFSDPSALSLCLRDSWNPQVTLVSYFLTRLDSVFWRRPFPSHPILSRDLVKFLHCKLLFLFFLLFLFVGENVITLSSFKQWSDTVFISSGKIYVVSWFLNTCLYQYGNCIFAYYIMPHVFLLKFF